MRSLVLIFFVMAVSCGKVQQEDTRTIRAEIEGKKIKRITDQDLLAQATALGEGMERKLNGDFKVECQRTYALDGLQVELYSKTDEVLSQDAKGQLQEAYTYALAQGQRVGANIQKLNDTLYAYSFPLREKSYLKLVCQADFAFLLMSTPQIVKSLP